MTKNAHLLVSLAAIVWSCIGCGQTDAGPVAEAGTDGIRDAGDGEARDGADGGAAEGVADGGDARDAAPDTAADGRDAPFEGKTGFDPRAVLDVLTGARPLPGGGSLGVRQTPAQRAAARDYLQATLERLGLTAKLHEYTTTSRGAGANVYAEVPSTTGSSEWLVLGAHYDTVAAAPGANDNASGVVMVLSLADRLLALPSRSRNVYVVLFDQEEFDPVAKTGLVGSGRFAAALVAAKTAVHSVHTIDQVGWDADGDLRVELEKPSKALRTLYEASALALGIPVSTTPVDASDHESFRLVGMEAIGITEEYFGEDTTPYAHMPTNAAGTIDWPYFESTLELVWGVVGTLVE